ncbi:MAG TPA: DUF2330 domain-containing protein, partial [Myxococcota bacterium]|nr:DUF2330 domain-containing protein [Myxococcota bacterium]
MHRPLALALALAAAPNAALACGGFFCSSVPIDQSKERIVFGIDEAKHEVEAHVQIFYQGAAQEFAWVVPVPAIPEVGVSSDELFQQLDARTAPQFYYTEEYLGSCNWDMVFYDEDMADADGALPPGAAEGAGGGGVTVIEQAQVGPYDQVTLQASDEAVLLEWLNDNGYIIPETVGQALAPYVAAGQYFVALKLSNDRDSGDITPIRMRYAGDAASIPLVLTSIAATPDMRLQPFILSTERRAVPSNYLHVRINEAAIDWLSYGSNYDAVVTKAADEAGGQAFATDYAGPSNVMDRSVYWADRYDLDQLRTFTDPIEFVNNLLWMGFPRNAQVQNLLRAFIPMPQRLVSRGIDERDFYNCLECYRDDLRGMNFDPDAFVDALDEVIVTPARDAQTMLDHFTYLTRMTSSMSPDEMTRDPLFVLNGDMEAVSNVHSARLVVDCTNGEDYTAASRNLILQDGTEIAVPSWEDYWARYNNGTSYVDDLDVPAAAEIEQTGASGAPTTVADNYDVIAAGVDLYNQQFIQAQLDEASDAAACGGCDATGATGTWTALGLLALGLRRR